ncbi:conserved hypothetical protein [Hyphomicrobiales bacterium]|nr:conserved hypothetical protein [Hyphomicrobiales bacterium]CAH1702229.1 conserved hypothetical protein [Hyphomicrobiales bacterium]CAI0346432.1 conserved hypothetical protein [Hyphomicrobiales bacterium]
MHPDRPTLTQVQIIRSLADALTWLERELSWGVPAQELRALTGRIGELYAAMITRGQMALAPNQRGYDVVSAEGEHISVKTITTSAHVSFNAATYEHVDRIMILRINVDPAGDEGVSIEEVIDKPAGEFLKLCKKHPDGLRYTPARRKLTPEEGAQPQNLRITARAAYDGHELVRYENGAIGVLKDGKPLSINVKGFLRPIAAELGIASEHDATLLLTTRQLGSAVIRALNLLEERPAAKPTGRARAATTVKRDGRR